MVHVLNIKNNRNDITIINSINSFIVGEYYILIKE